MNYHFLTGDALAWQFSKTDFTGEILVSRECLIDGPVKPEMDTLEAFWALRAAYLGQAYAEIEMYYQKGVAAEFEKLLHLPAGSEVNLWFEYDLFCQVNLWFSLWLLRKNTAALQIYRVFPIVKNIENQWSGFSKMDADALQTCFDQRVLFTQADLDLGAQLWEAYQNKNLKTLQTLSKIHSPCFPYLEEVINAELDRVINDRPEKTLQRILQNGVTDFAQVFQIFTKEEGIYGFGDLQVKKMYENII